MKTAAWFLLVFGAVVALCATVAGFVVPVGTYAQCGPPFLGGQPQSIIGEILGGDCRGATAVVIVIYSAGILLGLVLALVGVGLIIAANRRQPGRDLTRLLALRAQGRISEADFQAEWWRLTQSPAPPHPGQYFRGP